VRRAPAFFALLSLHHRTLRDVVRVQHPAQQPLPFPYVVAVASGIADALAAAASVGVVHLDVNADNVMVDDAEAIDFEAAQRGAAVDYSRLVRRFERPPVAVVVDWGSALHVTTDKVLRVSVDDRGQLSLRDGAAPWGSHRHASPELFIEWKRAHDELERAKAAVSHAREAMAAAVEREYSCGYRCVSLPCDVRLS
jgi:serine/threonine protein kinase